MLINLMFLVVAKKSRTFFGFPYSANEQVCRSWEGARPGSQPKLARGNIPYHGRYAQFINGGWLEGRNSLFSRRFQLFSAIPFFFCEFKISMSLNFSGSSVCFLGSSVKLMKSVSSMFHVPCLGTGYAISLQGVRKKLYCVLFVLHIHYYYYYYY